MERVRHLDRQSISILSGMLVTINSQLYVQQEKLASPNAIINFVKYCRISKAIAAETEIVKNKPLKKVASVFNYIFIVSEQSLSYDDKNSYSRVIYLIYIRDICHSGTAFHNYRKSFYKNIISHILYIDVDMPWA